ncbi:MAG: hypothetical protein P4L99_04620 [Chthoniobacter sp.]|nr:hypothetical protein [Chthoniobacter sp.]
MSKEFSKTLSQVKVLEYCDGPLLFTALDLIGTRYVCVFLETKETGSEYLCIPVSHARLNSFLNGHRDLRSLFDEPEVSEIYKVVTNRDDSETLTATPIGSEEVNEDMLPTSGYFVSKDDWTGGEEPQRMHSLVDVSLEVFGATNYPAIETYVLCDFLRGFQDTLRYARRKVSPLSRIQRSPRRSNVISDTEVYGFSLNSFTVNLRSSVSESELFGMGGFDRSVGLLTQLLKFATQDSELAIDFLRENKGHFVSAVKRMLAVATAQGCAFSVRWRASGPGSVFQSVRVTFDQAYRLQSMLAVQSELDIEQASYIGNFISLSENRWGFKPENGEEIYGFTDPEQKDQLAGVTYQTAKYTINCTEQLTKDGADRVRMHRVLIRITKED